MTMQEIETALEAVAGKISLLIATWDNRVAGQSAPGALINGRTFVTEMVANGSVGFGARNGVRVVYGDWNPRGNMGGSFYSVTADGTLRVRWRGSQYVQHDGCELAYRPLGGSIEVRPRYVGGRLITRIDAHGVYVRADVDTEELCPHQELVTAIEAMNTALVGALEALDQMLAEAERRKEDAVV